MSIPIRDLRYGCIVWAVFKDRNGFRKRRPAVVLTPTDEIQSDEPLVVACITTTFPQPPPALHVPLPWNANPRKVSTRLARRSAVVLNWLETVYSDEIESVEGQVPATQMIAIDKILKQIAADKDERSE